MAAQDGQNQRVESVDFVDFELAASWITMPTGKAVALEDGESVADRLAPDEEKARI